MHELKSYELDNYHEAQLHEHQQQQTSIHHQPVTSDSGYHTPNVISSDGDIHGFADDLLKEKTLVSLVSTDVIEDEDDFEMPLMNDGEKVDVSALTKLEPGSWCEKLVYDEPTRVFDGTGTVLLTQMNEVDDTCKSEETGAILPNVDAHIGLLVGSGMCLRTSIKRPMVYTPSTHLPDQKRSRLERYDPIRRFDRDMFEKFKNWYNVVCTSSEEMCIEMAGAIYGRKPIKADWTWFGIILTSSLWLHGTHMDA